MIYFTKLYDVKNPSRGTKLSAGIDFYIPDCSNEFIKRFKEKNTSCGYSEEYLLVKPHDRILIPSAIKVKIPEYTALIAYNKSGIATKLGLDVGASVIDSDYMGEIHLSLINTTSDPVRIYYGQKIIQFILTPILFDDILYVDSEDKLYKNFESGRKDGGFGSTGI